MEVVANKIMVRVFSTPVCPYCFALKEYLKAREEMVEKTGQMGVPVVDINGEFIVGFDKEKISKILGI